MGRGRNLKLVERRREYVRNYVDARKSESIKVSKAIKELSDKLFLSVNTIEKDLYFRG